MQSSIKQSSRCPVSSGASHGCGSVSSDDARGDASAAGESGLRFPEEQQHSGGDCIIAFKTALETFTGFVTLFAVISFNTCKAQVLTFQGQVVRNTILGVLSIYVHLK